MKRNNGCIGRKAQKSDKADFPMEILAAFSYREDAAISKFIGQINEMVDANVYQKLCYKRILQWLKLNGFLTEEFSQDFDKKIILPTEKGTRLGIRVERRSSSKGVGHMFLIYGKQAQEYIVQNMRVILNGETVK